MNTSKTKILILSYYWPPSGGSGVQRWMYFAKHLKLLGYHPIVITVDATQASYPVVDPSLLAEVEEIEVIRTATREPLGWYSRLVSGTKRGAIPQGEVKTNSLFGKIAAYIR
ncbi:MAG: glycosyl transferase family 1, partial [Flavobacteriaceae bacterium]